MPPVAPVGTATDTLAALKEIDKLIVPQATLAARVLAEIGPNGDFKTFAKDAKNLRQVLNFTGPDFAGNYDVKRRKVSNNTGTDLVTEVTKSLKASKDPNLKYYKALFQARTEADKAIFDFETRLLNGEKLPKAARSLANAVTALTKLKGKGGRAEAEDIAERVGVIKGLIEASAEIRGALGSKVTKLDELKAYADAVKPGETEKVAKQIIDAAKKKEGPAEEPQHGGKANPLEALRGRQAA